MKIYWENIRVYLDFDLALGGVFDVYIFRGMPLSPLAVFHTSYPRIAWNQWSLFIYNGRMVGKGLHSSYFGDPLVGLSFDLARIQYGFNGGAM